MAIPDRRVCFDYFRPHTTLSAWLEAYFEHRETPTLRQVFEHESLHSLYHINDETSVIFTLSHDPANVVPLQRLQEAFEYWQNQLSIHHTNYVDVHCSIFTSASFELLVLDLLFLKLIRLELIEIPETKAHEFFAHFRRPTTLMTTDDRARFYEKRASLLHQANSQAWVNSIEAFRVRRELEEALHRISELDRDIQFLKEEAQKL
jgi:hypothetical protein